MEEGKSFPVTLVCKNQLASLSVEQRDYLSAIEIDTDKLKTDPTNYELYYDRSVCHYRLGNYQASLDDANAAIQLNPTVYDVHYQKGLALIRLRNVPEGLVSVKKGIELRARQDDTKLSDIFNLVKYASEEMKAARDRHQQINSVSVNNHTNSNGRTTSNDPVDSTTDRPINGNPGGNNDPSIDSVICHTGNLVATNQQLTNNANQVLNTTIINRNGVSSSANNQFSNSFANNHTSSSLAISPDISNMNIASQGQVLLGPYSHLDHAKSAQFEWSIRRSERIFLHHTGEPGTSTAASQQHQQQQQISAISPRQQQQHQHPTNPIQRHKTNTSSIGSSRSQKSLHDTHESQAYQSNRTPTTNNKSKDGTTNSHIDSDIDVDDSHKNNQQYSTMSIGSGDSITGRKRLMIAPSSSMPATSQSNSAGAVPKDDSYSSKYKRLRRDRERARRGTSKLCTIKLSDLEELQRATNPSKRTMRVIAPIDGWLYSGELTIDDRTDETNGITQYVVKLDGDSTGSSYLFTQETVLNDVIKEVRVKTVSELRKGARICCYWSRTYKCLSTGVVTSRTFEATKSLVSVKYDNGDLSALPLEDLRLLPPDYPKYMSNCDPLLLARNGDGIHVSSDSNLRYCSLSKNRIVVDAKATKPIGDTGNSSSNVMEVRSSGSADVLSPTDVGTDHHLSSETMIACIENSTSLGEPSRHSQPDEVMDGDNLDDDSAIPQTHETIEFITRDEPMDGDEDLVGSKSVDDDHQVDIAHDVDDQDHDNLEMTDKPGLIKIESRASSEENNYGLEYRPWRFEGPPKRSKRHGRTYRDNYLSIRRGSEVIRVGDSAELMPRDESILPFIAKIDGLWATVRGEMRVRVRWYYRLVETEGEPYDLKDGENALFETDHFDENDVQSIYRSTKILSWTEYGQNHLGHVNKQSDRPKVFYLAGYYDPVRRVKHLRTDVKECQ